MSNSLGRYLAKQMQKNIEHMLRLQKLYPDPRTPEQKLADERRLARQRIRRFLLKVLRFPFSLFPRLIISLAYFLTTPLDGSGKYDTDDDGRSSKDLMLYRAKL